MSGDRPGWGDAAERELGAALAQMFGGRSDEEREQRYVDAARLLDVLRPLLTARDAAVRADEARRIAKAAPMMHADGSITLPPNPFGTSGTWADYDWNRLAEFPERVPSIARGLYRLIAAAVARGGGAG